MESVPSCTLVIIQFPKPNFNTDDVPLYTIYMFLCTIHYNIKYTVPLHYTIQYKIHSSYTPYI